MRPTEPPCVNYVLRADGFTPLFFARDRATAQFLVDEGADIGFNKNNCVYMGANPSANFC